MPKWFTILVIVACLFSAEAFAIQNENSLAKLSINSCPNDWHSFTKTEKKTSNSDNDFYLGYFYLHGICKEQNISLGMRLITNAADQNHAHAAFALAELYYHGNLIDDDIKRAEKYFLIAANGGHLVAQHRIGMIKVKAAITENERLDGLYWLGMAANQGDGFSAFMIGMMHQNGMNGLPKNQCLALDWYESARLLGFDDTTGIHQNLLLKHNQECN